jgi:Domain of Unknown Function with PDB structure (DUF3857)/Tetratricopeptide repeat
VPNPYFAVFCLFFAAATLAAPQTQSPDKPQPAKSDYSQEAFVIEQATFTYKFANDGTSTEEQFARVHVQSDAGVQQYGILTFSYASGTSTFDIEYVRFHKPDGSVVETPLDTVQDMPSEITRQAPFYSEAFCKSVFDDYSSFIQLLSLRDSSPSQPTVLLAPLPAISAALLRSIRDLPDSSDEDATRLEIEAWRAFGRNDLESAVASLQRSVAADPKFIRAWVIVGEFLMMQNRTEPAIDAFQKAIAANSDEPITRKLFALSLAARSKFTEAVPQWQAYIKLVPGDPDGFDHLGLALMELKRYDEAVPELETAIKLIPTLRIIKLTWPPPTFTWAVTKKLPQPITNLPDSTRLRVCSITSPTK